MDKLFIVNEDYLPDGWTFERLEKLLESKPVKLTKEALAEIVTPECLNMSEEELIKYINEHENIIPAHRLTAPQPRMVYAENLEKDDELNQEFPEVKDE